MRINFFLCLIICFLFLNPPNRLFANNLNSIDSLKNIIGKQKNDSNKVNNLLDLSTLYFQINNDSALKYIEISQKLSNSINWNLGKGLSAAFKSSYYENIGNFKEAINQMDIAIEFILQIKDSTKLWNYYTRLGNLYEYMENYPKALVFHFKGLQIGRLINSQKATSVIYSNIGLIYSAIKNDSIALDYFFKSLKINLEIKNNKGLGPTYSNIGMIYQKKQNFDSAIYYYHKSINYNSSFDDFYGASITFRNLGNIYSSIGDIDSAKFYLDKSLKNELHINNKFGIAEVYSSFGLLYHAMTIDSFIVKSNNYKLLKKDKRKNSQKSIEYIKSAIDIYNSIGAKSSTIGLYKFLSDIYYYKNDIETSFLYYRKYSETKDSVYKDENSIKISNLETNIQIEKKELELEKQKIETAKIKENQKFQFYFLSGGIAILIFGLIVAYVRYREKKKQSEQLAMQKNEIENQKSLLLVKNNEIMDSINYAATIQNALLPWSSVLNKSFKEHFIIYKPKNIVSGDSYWFQEVDGVKYLAVIDCTGHGVPGSMLTVIANSVLDDAVLSKKISSTSEILTYMNEKVTEVLNQRLAENSIRDGMEVALLAIHQDKIQFSGAGRPLFVRNGIMETYKTDKRGIAGSSTNENYNFNSIKFEKSSDLRIYLSSDGFADQMNENSKKYSTKRFIETLDRISEMPLDKQKEVLENEFYSHKGNREQIDDVTVIGIKI